MSVSGVLDVKEWRTLYWSISNFPSKHWMESPTFNFQQTQFRFILQLNISKNIGDDCYNMYLECTEVDGQHSREFETCVVSVRIQNKYLAESFFTKESVSRSVLESRMCIWSQERNHLLSRYDDLKIIDEKKVERLKFRCIFGPLETIRDEKELCPNIDGLKKLSLDFSNLLENTGASDIALKCRDRSFPVHRSILLARCEKLLKGARVGLVEIDDMDPGVLQQLLEYIYSGSLTKKSKEIIFDLYDVGMKYCVLPLTKSCAEYIAENLNGDNVHKALVLAYKYKDEAFKKDILAYCAGNEVDTTSGRWSMICDTFPNLACDVHLARIS